VAALEVWDDSPVPSWSQVRRQLRDDPGVWSLLERALGEHPATSGRLTGLRPLRPARPSFSTWLTGTWHPDGTDVLVKVNTTRRERFWMSAASQGAPGSVPHVFASDDALGPVDASWLVLERLPYTHDPGWGAVAFSSLLAAAARFQVFAAAVDTDLVFDEDVETIRRFALGGQDLCPEAGTVVSHLDRDWAWVEAMAPREVLFGDLHFGNAAFRSPPPDLAALLYDPIPRRQPWPFEPAYLEVLCNGSGLVREMAAIRRVQGRAVCERDEVDRLSVLFCGWLALAFWSMLLDWHADAAQRARLAQYVSAAAHLDRLRHDAGQLNDAPADLVAGLLDALDIQVLCRPEQHKATIWVTLTDTTPATIITALLATPAPAPPGRTPARQPRPHPRLGTRPYAVETIHDHDVALLARLCARCGAYSTCCRPASSMGMTPTLVRQPRGPRGQEAGACFRRLRRRIG
jgi:hypothetical protein